MKKITVLIIALIGLTAFSNAQISDSYSLNLNDIVIKQNGVFHELFIEECTFTNEIGNPQLPVKIVSYVLPYNSTVIEIEINSITQEKLSGNYYIFPTQKQRKIDGSESPIFVEPNLEIYNSNVPYPNKTVEIISDGYTHGYHVVTVAIYPIEYHPASREIYLRNISFTINYNGTFDSRKGISFVRQSQRRAELGKQFVQNMVKNSNDVESFRNNNIQIVSNSIGQIIIDTTRGGSTSAIDTLVPDYIIITNNALKPNFQILADWKTKKGVPTIIKTVEEIAPNYQGSDLQEKIRNYLKEAYTSYGASLFVLLGGDVNIIPARLAATIFTNKLIPTDLYYATIGGTWNANNNDIFGETERIHSPNYLFINTDDVDSDYDFFLGRAPAKNVDEANIFVNKIINYEKTNNIPNLNYYNNILIASAYLNFNTCGYLEQSFKEELKGYCNSYLTQNINTKFMFDDRNCCPNCSRYTYNLRSNCNPNNPTNYDYAVPGGNCISGNDELNRENFLSALNGVNTVLGSAKFHIVYHCDHSNVKSMGTSSKDKNERITNSDIDALNNDVYQQILFSNGCDPVTFHYDCIAKHYVNNPNGGGVAFIGNSDAVGYSERVQIGRFLKALYQNGYYNLGVAFQYAPEPEYFDNSIYTDPTMLEGENTIFYNRQKYHLTLLGDPEMPVWTDTPQTLSQITIALNPTVATSGNRHVEVTIPASFPAGKKLTVCVQKGNEHYEVREIKGNGTNTIVHNFYFLPHTTGIINVTITAKNYIPLEWGTNVIVDRNLNISNLIFYDDGTNGSIGNGDNNLDAGETIALSIELKNTGTTQATNVKAELTCNSPYISIISNYSTFPDISANNTENSMATYVFKIDSTAPEILLNDLNQIKCTLQITCNTNVSNYVYWDMFNIEVLSPQLEQGNKTVTGSLTAGSTIELDIDLFNKGKATATEVTATLTSSSPYVSSITNDTSSYQNIGSSSDRFGDLRTWIPWNNPDSSALQNPPIMDKTKNPKKQLTLQIEINRKLTINKNAYENI